MTPMKALTGLITVSALIFGAGIDNARAHCDGEDGPVAKATYKALETDDLNLVLPYAPASAEAQLDTTFAEAQAARTLGPAARKVADRLFLETRIRLHRAGEGVTFAGIKPAAIDHEPMIPAAEQAIESGDLQEIKAVLLKEIDHVLGERLAHARKLREASSELAWRAAARERISAELGLTTFAEGIH